MTSMFGITQNVAIVFSVRLIADDEMKEFLFDSSNLLTKANQSRFGEGKAAP